MSSKLLCDETKPRLLLMALQSTAVTWLVDLVVEARASLYSCLTVSQLVNSCGSGGELTQWARQQAGDWFLIQVSVVERSLEPCGISRNPEPAGQGSLGCSRGPLGQGSRGGCVTAELSACTRGLVKRAQDHVNNGTSQAQTPGYRAVTASHPASTQMTDMTC